MYAVSASATYEGCMGRCEVGTGHVQPTPALVSRVVYRGEKGRCGGHLRHHPGCGTHDGGGAAWEKRCSCPCEQTSNAVIVVCGLEVSKAWPSISFSTTANAYLSAHGGGTRNSEE